MSKEMKRHIAIVRANIIKNYPIAEKSIIELEKHFTILKTNEEYKQIFDKLPKKIQDCVFRWISRLTDEGVGPGERWESHDQVVAVAHSKCGIGKREVGKQLFDREKRKYDVWISKRKFDEGKHKRDSGGQFSTQEGEKAPKEQKPKKAPKPRKERKPGNISQEEAKYTDSSKVTGQRCSNCINILRMKNSPVRRCTKVKGIVLDSGWSQFWKASRKAEDPTRV